MRTHYSLCAFLIAFLLTLLGLVATVDRSSASHGAPAPNQNAAVGTNLMRIFSRSSDWPFVDVFKASLPWVTLRNGQIVTNTGPIDLDAHGWVRSLPAGNNPEFNAVATSVLRELDGHYPAGQYIVLYEGEGTLTYGGDAAFDASASIAGRDVLTVTPANAGIVLRITATDPNGTGNYLRNIRVIMPGFEETYATQLFHPLFLENSSPSKCCVLWTGCRPTIRPSMRGRIDHGWTMRVTRLPLACHWKSCSP